MSAFWSGIAKMLGEKQNEVIKVSKPSFAYASDSIREFPISQIKGVWIRINRESPISAWSDWETCQYEEAIRVDGLTLIEAKKYRGRSVNYSVLPKGDYHSMTKEEFEKVLI